MTKGAGLSILPILAGFRFDAERLLRLFKEHQSMRFTKFAECFRSMKFSHIFHGRQTEPEYREFCERILCTAVGYCMPPLARELLDQVAGLYLLYSLYVMQVEEYRMKIRVTPRQIDELHALASLLRHGGHLDTLYVLRKLIVDHAFHVCAYEHEHNPLTSNRRWENEMLTAAADPSDLTGPSATMNQLATLKDDQLTQSLDVLHREYNRSKVDLAHNFTAAQALVETTTVGGPVDLLKGAHDDYEQKLARRQQQLHGVGGTATGASGDKSPRTSTDVRDLRAGLRQKAYAGHGKSLKHRRHRNFSIGSTDAVEQQKQTKTKEPAKSPKRHKLAAEANEPEAEASTAAVDAQQGEAEQKTQKKKAKRPLKLKLGKRRAVARADERETDLPMIPTKRKVVHLKVAAPKKNVKKRKASGDQQAAKPQQPTTPAATDINELIPAAASTASSRKERRGRPTLAAQVNKITATAAPPEPPTKTLKSKPTSDKKKKEKSLKQTSPIASPPTGRRRSARHDSVADSTSAFFPPLSPTTVAGSTTTGATSTTMGTKQSGRRRRSFRSAAGAQSLASGQDLIDSTDRMLERLKNRLN